MLQRFVVDIAIQVLRENVVSAAPPKIWVALAPRRIVVNIAVQVLHKNIAGAAPLRIWVALVPHDAASTSFDVGIIQSVQSALSISHTVEVYIPT